MRISDWSSDVCSSDLSLHHGMVDCVLLALPYACGDVEAENLFDDALFVAFPGDQSDDLPAMVSADHLDPAQMLILEDGHCLQDHVLAACNPPNMRAAPRLRGPPLATPRKLAETRRGNTHQ